MRNNTLVPTYTATRKKARKVSLRSGLSLDESTRALWEKLVAENKERTTVKLSEPLRLACSSRQERHVEVIPSGTEVSLFCNMPQSRRLPAASMSRRVLGTFFLPGVQISVLSDMRICVNVAGRATVKPQPERHRVAVRGSLTLAARW